MKTMPVSPEVGQAACSDPQHLPLVDAAFGKPGGPEAQEMKRTLCRACPVAEQCLAWAMTHGEAGVWGGTSPKFRTIRDAPTIAGDNTAGHRKAYQPSRAEILCRELGVRGTAVKRWAYKQGLTTSIKGRVALVHVEAWAAAHKAA